ncbi:ACR2.2 [Symbiodinium natans]|uniref:ACR2.2 protein n=1 Tax=Symbiodinium natans TaxID=878477 RepID=A0A812K855_9DINO|nr:ACR2.2 [Symbiodinium natans]
MQTNVPHYVMPTAPRVGFQAPGRALPVQVRAMQALPPMQIYMYHPAPLPPMAPHAANVQWGPIPVGVPIAHKPFVSSCRSYIPQKAPMAAAQETLCTKMANAPFVQPAAVAARSFAPQQLRDTIDPKPRVEVRGATKTVVHAPRPVGPTLELQGPDFAVPLDKGVERLEPEEVFQLLKQKKCVLLDVRDADRSCGFIEGALHEPTSFQNPLFKRVPELVQKYRGEQLVIFHCQFSLHRGPQCANWYRKQADPNQRVGVLDRGFRGWQQQKLPVVQSHPESQIQAAANRHALSVGRRMAGAGA